MKNYVISMEVGNYDSPKNYDIETEVSLLTIAEVLSETKFILATNNGTEYLINTKYIVSIRERRDLKPIDRPKSNFVV